MMQKSNMVKMEERHIHLIAELEKLCFSSPWSEQMVEGEFKNPNATYYICENGDEFYGYAGIHRILDEGYITNIAVHPDYRRRGIASNILRELILENADLAFITLEVRASNEAAIALYESFGFEKIATRPRYYSNPEEDALLMTRYKEKNQ